MFSSLIRLELALELAAVRWAEELCLFSKKQHSLLLQSQSTWKHSASGSYCTYKVPMGSAPIFDFLRGRGAAENEKELETKNDSFRNRLKPKRAGA